MLPLWTQTLHTSASYHLTMRQKDMWTASAPSLDIIIILLQILKFSVTYFLIWSICVRSAFTTLMASEGSFPDMDDFRAAVRLSTC